MPIQAPQWTDYLNCPVCCREFGAPPRSPVSLGCGHTICRHCLKHLHRQQCPFDKIVIQVDVEDLVVNTAILQLAGYPPPAQPYHPPCIQALPELDRHAFDVVVKCFEQLALYLKNCATNNNVSGSRLSRPMQRKVVTLLQCAITDEEGRGKAARAARSLGERTVTELILQHQNPQQLSANLWAAVRARGCQFLGPVMQEEVLKLVLLALEDGSALSRKVLVMFVVQRLEPHFPQASKTSIGHVVQLLYRASCFKVSKRESDSSLMQLKEEFRTYEALRREHDAQIVQIANEAGLRIAPDQWSALLYGATAHKSHMQSIIDKLQTPQSFYQSVQELFIAQQRTGDTAHLVGMSVHLDRLANIDPSPDAASPTWQQLAEILTSLREVVSSLVLNIQQHVSARDSNHNTHLDRSTDTTNMSVTPTHGRYKVMCRDSATRAYCPRSTTCNFAHTDDEERFGTASNNPPNVNGNFNNYIMPMGSMPHVPLPPLYPGYPMQQQIDNYNLPSMAPIQSAALQPEMKNDFETARVENLQTPPSSFPSPMRAPQPGMNGVMPAPMRFIPRYNNERMRYPQPAYDGLPPRQTQPFVARPPPPMPNIYVVSQDMGNITTFGITNNASERRHDIIPNVNVPAYTPTTIEAHPDPVWPPINNNMFNVSPSRRGLTGERLLNAAADRLADDQELEQELQALERRIDTEFKNTD